MATKERAPEEDTLTLVTRLVTELGPPQLLSLIAGVATNRANELLRQGASPQAARMSREAAILNQAAHDILE